MSDIITEPNNPESYLQLAARYREQQAFEQAIATLEQALAQSLESAAIYSALAQYIADYSNFFGTQHTQQYPIENALTYAEKALALEPGNGIFQINLASLYLTQNRSLEAGLLLQEVESPYRDTPEFYINYGKYLFAMNKIAEGTQYFQSVLAADPEQAAAHYFLSTHELGLGLLESGWAHYEAAVSKPYIRNSNTYFYALPIPAWRGESLQGKSILIMPEQGLGEVILFAHCFPDIIEQTEHIYFLCPKKLLALFETSFPKIHCIPLEKEIPSTGLVLPKTDYKAYIGSLPCYLRKNPDTFSGKKGFLRYPAEILGDIPPQLKQLSTFPKIGIAWRSAYQTVLRDKHHCHIEELFPLLALQQVSFVTLQYDDSSAEIDTVKKTLGVDIHRIPNIDMYDDLAKTAALMSQLDFVVATANSVAHLAGALGVDTALLLVQGGTWEQLGTPHYPWFPSVRCFKQQREDDWSHPIAEITQYLQERYR